MKIFRHFFSVVCLSAIMCLQVQATETIKTRIGELEFTHDFANGYPTDKTVKMLFNEMDFQRACQAYILGHTCGRNVAVAV